MIIILLTIIAMMIVKIKRLSDKNKIYYNNYKQCLMVLGDYDPKLKEYLESGKSE